jgi:hypothetical protein
MPEFVRCYVERRGTEWEGVCIDFDLAVQGHSFREVQDRLARAIREYLDYVKTLPEDEQARFLRRRVPFCTMMAFALLSFMTALRARRRGDDGGNRGYTILCPA